jgi:processive 1,2-diacylglycerol beta-glucosyltransferase
MKKVQIFYASIGSGHLSAARSIANAITSMDPGIQVELRDIFRQNRANALLQETFSFIPSLLFPNLYTFVWRHGTFKWAYGIITRTGPLKKDIISAVESFSPDLIICTHTFPCSVISHWKKKHASPPLMAVATDQFLHPYWSIDQVDAFIAPNEAMVKELMHRGLAAEKIHNFGIPVSVLKQKKRVKTTAKSSVRAIVLAGSFRVAPYLVVHPRIYQLINFIRDNDINKINWWFVFGNAKRLYSYAQTKLDERSNIKMYTFPKNMQELIALSDIVFTKPGGLTVAEALAYKKPIVLLNSGAGQERENTNFVVQSGSGILINSKAELEDFLTAFSSDPQKMMGRFKVIELPLEKSAERIAKLACQLINQK